MDSEFWPLLLLPVSPSQYAHRRTFWSCTNTVPCFQAKRCKNGHYGAKLEERVADLEIFIYCSVFLKHLLSFLALYPVPSNHRCFDKIYAR
jgi:hypothetical protein